MSNPHVLVIPYPAQGHVNPLMHFSQSLATHGFKITFVNTDFNHKRVLSAMVESEGPMGSQVNLVSIPDGLGPEENRNELGKLSEGILKTMPAKLEELIRDINSSNGDNGAITCVFVDVHMGWALEVADKMGIRGAVLWPAAAAVFALEMSIPRFIDDCIINCDGVPIKAQTIQLSPSTPAMDTADLPWYCIGDSTTNRTFFQYITRFIKALKLADWWLCNTTYELEPGAFSLVPKLLPIGPLMANNDTRNAGGQFWPEDSACLKWLDQQQPCSVIYVAFGSFTILDQTQFQELALGLELTGRPFLWVVRPGTIDESNDAHQYKLQGNRGKIVSWAPQQKVLNHPAISCFISHCGWNSTIEGVSNGVPFLCWPYFADQFFNKSYICDFWKVGLGFDLDENGIITRGEVKKKVEQVLGDQSIRARSLELKRMAMNNISEGGQSSKNFNNFIKWLKE